MFLLSKRKLSLRRFIYQSHTKVYMHNIDHEVYLCYNLKIDLVVNYFGGKPMKREEKNQQTQRRIMDSALAEFAEKGHGGSSVNTICAAQGISKGSSTTILRTRTNYIWPVWRSAFSASPPISALLCRRRTTALWRTSWGGILLPA